MKIENHRLTDVEFVRSPNINERVINPVGIIMHYTGGWALDEAVEWLCNPRSKASAHLVIDRNGDVRQLVDFNRRAWHAGPSRYEGLYDLNNYTIGIELVNPGALSPMPNGMYMDAYGNVVPKDSIGQPVMAADSRFGSGVYAWPSYSAEQLSVLDVIVEELVETYAIHFIAGHRDVDTRGWKVDPGPAFPMRRYQRLLDNRWGYRDLYRVEVSSGSSLNFRSGAYIGDNILGQLSNGDIVEKIGDSVGEWMNVRFDDQEGWVHSAYLRPQPY